MKSDALRAYAATVDDLLELHRRHEANVQLFWDADDADELDPRRVVDAADQLADEMRALVNGLTT